VKTGLHRPSQIIAEDYEYVLSYSRATQEAGWPIPPINIDAVLKLQNTKKFATVGLGTCTVCGTHFIYGDVWHHVPTNEYIHIGHECADKYRLIADRADWEAENGNVRRLAAAERIKEEKREREEQKEKDRQEFLNDHLGLEDWLKHDHYIVQDIAANFKRYGNLSDKQIALVKRLATEVPEEKVEAPEGKHTFRGKVVSVKSYENQYGLQLKCTVKVTTDKGSWLVWGTVPAKILDETVNHGGSLGCTVEITATLKRGDESHFVFMQRPRGKLIEFAEDHNPEECNGCIIDNDINN